MSVIPYLTFQGTCLEAMTFYAEVFGTKIDMIMKASEMPDFSVPDDQKDKIAHASMKFADGELFASDNIVGGSGAMEGCSVMVSLPTSAECQTVFEKLAEGGAITMPFQPTFWAAGFGTLTDRFGIPWMISSEQEPT